MPRSSKPSNGIRTVTIELTNGTQIKFAPSWPSLPVQIIKQKWSGLMESPIEMSVDDFMALLQRISKGLPPEEGPNYCGA